MKDNYHVNILTTTGEEYYYFVENTTKLDIHAGIVHPPDGYVEFEKDGETHYLSEKKIVRFRIISEKEKKELDLERIKKNSEMISNLNF